MTLKEFVNDITAMMKNNKWEKKTLQFNTIDRDNLEYLSIYIHNKKVIIDIGTDKDSKLRNAEVAAMSSPFLEFINIP